MENNEKRVISPEFILKSELGSTAWRGTKTALELFFIILVGGLLLITTGLIGFIIDVVVITLLVVFKKKQKKDMMTAYVRTMQMIEMREFEYTTDEDTFTVYKGNFGPGKDGKPLWVQISYISDIHSAKPGDYFYVAFKCSNDEPIACYLYDKCVLDPRMEVRP